MKQIYTIISLMIMAVICSLLTAQAIYWEENFEIDTGEWDLNGNWSITGNSLKFNWFPEAANFDMSATSPLISLPANTDNINIIQYVDQFEFDQDGEFFEIAVLHNGDTEVIWLHTENEDWGEIDGSLFTYSLAQYSGEDIQLRFRTAGGSTYNINSWDIYYIAIEASCDNDLASIDISCDVNPTIGINVPIDIRVKNVGLNEQDNYTVSLYQADGSLLDFVEADINIGPGEEVEFTLYWTPISGGSYEFYGEVELPGDENSANDQTELLTLDVPNQYDITLLDFIVEDNLNVGEEAEFILHIENSGSNLVSAADLTLVLMTEEGEYLDSFSPFIGFVQPGEDVFYELYYTPDTIGELTVIGGVLYQNDQNLEDNMSEPVTISVFAPNSTLLDIGPTNFWSPVPFNFGGPNSYSQMIYLESELSATGFIDLIGFVYDFSDEVNDSRIKVYMGETSRNSFDNQFVDIDSLSIVFDGYVDFATGLNNCYLMLDNPYYYDGGNLIVAIHRIYNWHDNQGIRRFNGGFIDSERTISIQDEALIDPHDPGENYPSSFQVRTKFVFNSSGVGELTGYVSDSFNNPLENTLVSVTNNTKTALTGSDGLFCIPMLYEGDYTIKISKPGFVEQLIDDVTIMDNQTTDLTVSLNESPAANNPPSNVSVEVFQRNNINISWDEVTFRSNRDLVGYYVYRNNMRINSGPIMETAYSDNNLSVGEYQYFVTSFYDDGESVASEILNIEVTDMYIPQITRVTQIENEEALQINWNIILRESGHRESILRNLTGFNLYRNGDLINAEPIPVIEPYGYIDYSVENLCDYQYTVTAIFGDEESEHSIPYDFYSMFSPRDVFGICMGSYIELYWTPPSEPTAGDLIGYNVYDAIEGDLLINSELITDNTYIVEDVNPGQQYGFFVTAVYNTGESIKSSIFYITASENELYPPQNLDGNVDYSDVILSWNRPVQSGVWLHWDNNEIGGNFSMPEGEDFIAAVRFDEWDLLSFDYHELREIAFMANEATADYTLIIWRRDLFLPDSPMEIKHMEELTDIEPNSWNFVRLDDVLDLENYQELYEFTIGIMYSNYTGNPAVYDTGSNTNSKSDLIFTVDEEGNLTDYDIDANWKIRIYWYQLEMIIPNIPYTGVMSNSRVRPATLSNRAETSFEKSVRDREKSLMLDNRTSTSPHLYLIGYNLFRDNELIAFIPHFYSSYIDQELADGIYDYHLTAVYEFINFSEFFESDPTETLTIAVETVDIKETSNLPYITELKGNYPNPFNPETAISFSLNERSNVRLEVYNIRGQRVAMLVDDELPQGEHRVVWNGKTDNGNSVGSGVYFYRLTADNYIKTRKMMLLK